IAFCCLGDPMLYSTFHTLYREIVELNPEFEVEIVPGISSFSSALAKTRVFVEKGIMITTPEFEKPDVLVVMKAKKPKEIENRLRNMGFKNFWFLERMFMNGEKMSRELPERADYFSIVVAKL
ncbi:MAG: SAM-dependent methyltransferase, partial [Archaeoglobaceae archaeon]